MIKVYILSRTKPGPLQTPTVPICSADSSVLRLRMSLKRHRDVKCVTAAKNGE